MNNLAVLSSLLSHPACTYLVQTLCTVPAFLDLFPVLSERVESYAYMIDDLCLSSLTIDGPCLVLILRSYLPPVGSGPIGARSRGRGTLRRLSAKVHASAAECTKIGHMWYQAAYGEEDEDTILTLYNLVWYLHPVFAATPIMSSYEMSGAAKCMTVLTRGMLLRVSVLRCGVWKYPAAAVRYAATDVSTRMHHAGRCYYNQTKLPEAETAYRDCLVRFAIGLRASRYQARPGTNLRILHYQEKSKTVLGEDHAVSTLCG
eukprot:1403277-Rhodomonas_salina.1